MKYTYYELPLDRYNQPNGQVREVEMTKEEFDNRHPNRYIFESKRDAENRAHN